MGILKPVSVDSILVDFQKILVKLDNHASNMQTEAAEAQEKIREYQGRRSYALDESARAGVVAAKIAALIS